jgi:type III restriction enzyme
MPSVVIDNPILNSPFREPARHFRFDEDGITNEIAEGRRRSTYFMPIAQPKVHRGQLALPGGEEEVRENDFINRVREHVSAWRGTNYRGVTPVTRDLLDYWNDPTREKPLFFCQIEALEAAIFLGEVAGRTLPWIENKLHEENQAKNPGLYRIAFKMATGSGKTVVMAMLIAWHTLNKLANPQDKRFSDTFLVVTPGITIRDRLQVLRPNLPGNYYLERDLVTPDQLQALQAARIEITNFHAFLRHDTFDAASLTKKVLAGPDGDLDRFKETPEQMVRRVCRTLGTKKNIVVINDEAHHCYQSAPQTEEEALLAEERADAKANQEAARIWLNGLRAVAGKLGIRAIYDLSATPFFLRGSGFREGTLFPWVVSDFSLIDAIESGIVKIPRVPVSDDSMAGALPTYRDLWPRIREWAPRKGRSTEKIEGEPILHEALETALVSLYGHYEKSYQAWKSAGLGTPPVFIVVCQNTNISKIVFDWIAGWRTSEDDSTPPARGHLAIFSNVVDEAWTDRPNTLLIDSAQIESGEAMDPAFKKIASAEIDEFKREYIRRFPGRSVEDVTDEDLLREVMNTIGKKDRLGEQVRCVVSVSMLTEGWDANTVTHILGVRAFGTQLLCEQVVGRGLRRVSYEAGPDGHFAPEYAEVYGVPFSFLPTAGQTGPVVSKPLTRVHALPEREELEITFPRLLGYRFDFPTEHLTADFTADSRMELSTAEVPTMTELNPIVGLPVQTNLDLLKVRRVQEVAFRITKRVLDTYFRADDDAPQPWLFPQLLPITERWLSECLALKDHAFLQMLLIAEWEHDAAERICRAIQRGAQGEKRIMPILRPYDSIGSTRYVDFTTTKGVYDTVRSHLNCVVLDSRWEAKLASVLDEMPEVRSYVKNQGLNFRIPYTFQGDQANYLPDFIVRFDDGRPDPLNLIIEVTGQFRREKAAKAATAIDLWVPAVNNHGGLGRWSFLEVIDPWDAANLIRAHVAALPRGLVSNDSAAIIVT